MYITGQPSSVPTFNDTTKESNEVRCSNEKDLGKKQPRSVKEQCKVASSCWDEKIFIKTITEYETVKRVIDIYLK